MELGDTVTHPPDVDTVPTPLLMEALSALTLVQVSVADPPCWMVVGLMDKLPVGGGAIVTVACAVAVPPVSGERQRVRRRRDGETVTDPPDTGDTLPHR